MCSVHVYVRMCLCVRKSAWARAKAGASASENAGRRDRITSEPGTKSAIKISGVHQTVVPRGHPILIVRACIGEMGRSWQRRIGEGAKRRGR